MDGAWFPVLNLFISTFILIRFIVLVCVDIGENAVTLQI